MRMIDAFLLVSHELEGGKKDILYGAHAKHLRTQTHTSNTYDIEGSLWW